MITVFHKPSLPASTRVVTFLKQANANAQATATEDQASSHEPQSNTERVDFNLDIQEGPPTGDQLKSIMEYIGGHNAGKVILGARDLSSAMTKLKEDAELFQRPLVTRLVLNFEEPKLTCVPLLQVVDWHQGKVAIGEDQSEILKLLKSVPKETTSS